MTPAVEFATHDHFLKRRCLELAQWLAPGEAMSAVDANTPLSIIVTRICSSPSVTPVQMALIAVGLADFIERPLTVGWSEP